MKRAKVTVTRKTKAHAKAKPAAKPKAEPSATPRERLTRTTPKETPMTTSRQPPDDPFAQDMRDQRGQPVPRDHLQNEPSDDQLAKRRIPREPQAQDEARAIEAEQHQQPVPFAGDPIQAEYEHPLPKPGDKDYVAGQPVSEEEAAKVEAEVQQKIEDRDARIAESQRLAKEAGVGEGSDAGSGRDRDQRLKAASDAESNRGKQGDQGGKRK